VVEALQMGRLIFLTLHLSWFFRHSSFLGLYPNFEKWPEGLLLLAIINSVSKYTGSIACLLFLQVFKAKVKFMVAGRGLYIV
jgi:hypothetical protein